MTYRGRLVFPALAAAGVLWGTTVPLSKLALAWLTPGWLAFARFALAAALLAIVSRSRLRGALSPAILITGAAGYGGSVLLQNLGIERTSVTHAALLIGATPVLVAAVAAVVGHGVARPVAWVGFALSLAGVGIIAGRGGAGSSFGGDGLVLAGQLASAGFTVAQARLLRGRDPVAVTALQLMAAAVAVLPAALAGPAVTHGPSRAAMLAVTGLILAGTVAPTTLFAFGQSRVRADVAGAFLNLEPLVGAAIGIVLFGNPAGAVQVVGGVAILSGIGLSTYQVVRAERARRPAARTPAAALAASAADANRLPTTLAGAAAPVPRQVAARTPASSHRLKRGTGPGQAGRPLRPTGPGVWSGADPHRRRQPKVARRPADAHGELTARRNPAGQRLVVTSKRPRRDRDSDLR